VRTCSCSPVFILAVRRVFTFHARSIVRKCVRALTTNRCIPFRRATRRELKIYTSYQIRRQSFGKSKSVTTTSDLRCVSILHHWRTHAPAAVRCDLNSTCSDKTTTNFYRPTRNTRRIIIKYTRQITFSTTNRFYALLLCNSRMM